jgi:uncharacterized protein
MEKNVLGTELQSCCTSPMTGFLRTGFCGSHVVCALITSEFLEFTKSKGNDLSTPALAHGFPGLKPGDKWCLCASRWKEALDANVAPPVYLEATHEAVLKFVALSALRAKIA